jgi:catechol 2,3-dioxygenase-like lactoylglutathione lyase family enzyme
MQFTRLTLVLHTWDLPASIEFYTQVLGFECTEPENGMAYLLLGELGLVLATPPPDEPLAAPNFTGSLYFDAPYIEAFWEQVKHSPHVAYPLRHLADGLAEFALRDNNGYLLRFGHALENP